MNCLRITDQKRSITCVMLLACKIVSQRPATQFDRKKSTKCQSKYCKMLRFIQYRIQNIIHFDLFVCVCVWERISFLMVFCLPFALRSDLRACLFSPVNNRPPNKCVDTMTLLLSAIDIRLHFVVFYFVFIWFFFFIFFLFFFFFTSFRC